MTSRHQSVRRRGLFVALAILSTIGLAAPASAAGGDNVVLAFNYVDDSHLPRSGVAVTTAAADTVETENLAYAKGSCDACRTVAVAVQAVLITSDASVITPKNAAVAVNEGCTSCETMAAAYQYVVTTGGPVHLSATGQQQVAELRREIGAVAASGLPFLELDAALDQLVERLRTVIDEEIVSAGGTPHGAVERQVRTDAA